MHASRWLTFSASAVLQCSTGVSYCFSVYSGQLKAALGYSQAQVEGLASPLVALLVVGWLPGVAYDALRHRRRLGPRLVLGFGLLEHFCGYFGLWLVASQRLQLPYIAVVGLTVMAFNGSNWIDTACVATNVRNFPGHRGYVVGVLKSLVGLSASIYTSLYVALLKPDGVSFLLVIALVPAFAGPAAMTVFNAVPCAEAGEDDNERGDGGCKGDSAAGVRFWVACYVVLLLGVYQLATSGLLGGVPSLNPDSAPLRWGVLAGLAALLAPLLVLWLGSGPLLIRQRGPRLRDAGAEEAGSVPAGARQQGSTGPNGWMDGGMTVQLRTDWGERKGSADMREPLLAAAQDPAHAEGAAAKAGPGEADGPPSLSVRECAASASFWLLLVTFGLGTGCGLMFVNNLGQLVESIGGGGKRGPDVLVSLFSVFSAAGRLACGAAPEQLLRSYGIPRTAFLVGAAGLTAAAAGLTSLSSLALLWVAAPAAGFAFGCHWSLMPPLASELFGMRSFATLYCLLQFGTTFGTYALATRLAGGLYQWRAALHGDEGNVCYGADCFRAAFVTGAALELCAMVLALVLHFRTRALYVRRA